MALEPGQAAEVARVYTAADVAAYVRLGGHAATTAEVPEPLIGALFSYLLGVELPGAGTSYLKQETRFEAPVPIGQRITARVEITRVRPEKNLVDLVTTCTNEHGERVCEGRALVHVGDVNSRG